ncbi:hypothetical protein EMO92_05340 [Bifidobacterium reuteri]|uniref:Ricin B lectin domain-containing protein n=1 Tax=Bifidobacterium reuteri TaxID=983706 RepID=A0A5J5E8H1_9BIFI|nr:hypothetical protein EMO92_05340 [Bifidobacterium reuteri]
MGDRGFVIVLSRINGISGSVDLNAFGYKTYQAAIDVRNQTAISIPNGTYKIASAKKSSAVLDVSGGSTANAANVQLYAGNDTDAQKWVVK